MRICFLPLITSLVICLSVPVFGQSIHSFNSGMNCYGMWRLPDTGQTLSTTTTFGEDHDYQPAATQPSYTILNPVGISSVTLDNVTGLMWITNPRTDAAMGGTYTWANALAACEGKDYAGYSDWRLPNVLELMSLYDFNATSVPAIDTTAFPNTRVGFFWTSTTYPVTPANAMRVCTDQWAFIGNIVKTTVLYVRCVRGG
ncbi:MAG: hypothetical protein UY62_C0070G0003 [Parcubacteria group bacterium GW2011_GWF2_50_9]|nr:MAG: hypothetical protein UY62_C0070G0003 [Parcubacteria group bacterium GW2011_GWF2_50_9]